MYTIILYENLDFSLSKRCPDQSILISSLGIFHRVYLKKITHCIVVRSQMFIIFAFADENKELNLHFQYINCPYSTICVQFLNK